MGHVYQPEKQPVVKKWQPVVKAHALPEVSTPNNPIDNSADNWTMVANNRKLRGKVVLQGKETSTEVNCSNVFDLLGSESGPLVDTGHVP